MEGKIYGLIGQAMKEIGAIGKDSKNAQHGFMYRGIDAVYNALNPVMAKYGLFICPEILDQRREERTTKGGTVLTYSILTIKYTLYALDGSNISCTVIGEGMDSGDKASNKAMSVAMKYAMFQLFFIPTEAVDPDAEVHTDVLPKAAPKTTKQEAVNRAPVKPQKAPAAAEVTVSQSVPQKAPEAPKNPVLEYLARERDNLAAARGISKEQNSSIWTEQVKALRNARMIPEKKLSEFSQQEAEHLVGCMYSNFAPTGTELKNVDGESA